MGIKGLWQALRAYVDDGHLSQFRGQRVAVDMYVWLHRCVHRSVRIRTEAVVAYLDAKYSNTALPSETESIGGGGRIASYPKDCVGGGDADGEPASGSASPAPPPLCVDDVLVLDDQLLTLVLDKVAALQRFGVVPVCVFDGAEMPMKGGTDEERQRRRTEAFQEALRKLEQLYCEVHRRRQWGAAASATSDIEGGGSGGPVQSRRASSVLPHDHRLYEEAVVLMEKAVDISTELAHAVIQVLKEERHVECIVAPYEADAQLAFLCREGYVAAAASEDSDLIAYYCPCIISKLDTFSGKCEVLQPPQCAPLFFRTFAGSSAAPASPAAGTALNGPHRHSGSDSADDSSTHARLRAAALTAVQQRQQQQQRGGDGRGEPHGAPSAGPTSGAASFTYESFLLGCIMSGCDYVPNLRGIGVKKAFRLVARATSLRECFSTLEREYGFPADELARYRHRILEAFYCFAHHLVYSPLTHELVTYHPLPPVPVAKHGNTTSSSSSTAALKTQLVGALWPAQTAQEVCAQCLKDPCTLQLYQGTFHACVARYLQRTRRGQTSLTAFGRFQSMTSNRVVVHLSQRQQDPQHHQSQQQHQQRQHTSSGDAGLTTQARAREGEADFGAPLKRQRVATGFIGDAGRKPHAAASGSAAAASEVVVVRSRFFMVRGRTAVQERWSDSGSESDDTAPMPDTCASAVEADTHRDDLFSALAHKPAQRRPAAPSAALEALQITAGSCTDASTASSLASADDDGTSPLSAPSPAFARAVALSPASSPSAESASEGEGAVAGMSAAQGRDASSAVGVHGARGCLAETPDVEPYTYGIEPPPAEAPTTSLDVSAQSSAPAAACSCPFGYWQCNKAHSVFESCFLGKQWGREAPPPPSPSATSPASQLSCATLAAPPSPSASLPASPTPAPQPVASLVASSTSLGSGGGPAAYVPRAFRPPRSTAAPLLAPAFSPESPPASGVSPAVAAPLHTRDMNAALVDASTAAPLKVSTPLTSAAAAAEGGGAGDRTGAVAPPLPSHRAAVRHAIFEKMIFKKA